MIGVTYGQQYLIDSLSKRLNDPELKETDRVIIMSNLAKSYLFIDCHKGLNIANDALTLARKQPDKEYYIAYVYTCSHMLALHIDSILVAKRYLDSALWYAEISNHNDIKGFARILEASFYKKKNDDDESTVKLLLKSLDILAGAGAPVYESIAYYKLGAIYAYKNDGVLQEKYAVKALDKALESKNWDRICNSYQAIATYFTDEYERKKNVPATEKKNLLDSALAYYNIDMALCKQHENSMYLINTYPIAAINMAYIYGKYYPPHYQDTAYHYISLALESSTRLGYKEVQLICYGQLGDMAMKGKNYAQAEKMYLEGKKIFESTSEADMYSGLGFTRDLAEVCAATGRYKEAFDYYKQYIDYYSKEYENEKVKNLQMLEVQYDTEKKDLQLKGFEEKEAIRKRMQYVYVIMIAVALIALFFVYRFFRLRMRVLEQQRILLKKGKDEAELQARLKTEEARRLELEKHEASLLAQLKAEEAARSRAEHDLLLREKGMLQKELMAEALQVEQKNDLLLKLQEKLKSDSSVEAPTLSQIGKIINEGFRQDEEFIESKQLIKDIHPDFFARLQEKAENKLTSLDMKYCAYIYMQLSSKQIAGLLSVEPKSIRMAKYRLKQKLGLSKEEDLERFIRSVLA